MRSFVKWAPGEQAFKSAMRLPGAIHFTNNFNERVSLYDATPARSTFAVLRGLSVGARARGYWEDEDR
eukprot:1576826-Pyramimonas_sp.AAC.1